MENIGSAQGIAENPVIKIFKLRTLMMWTDPAREIEQDVNIDKSHFETNPVPTDPNILDTFSSITPQQMLSQGEDDHSAVNHPPFELDENTLRSLQQFIESQGLHHTTQTSEQVQLIAFMSLI